MKNLLWTLFFVTLLTGCGEETPPPQFEEFHIDEVSTVNCNPEEENCAFISIDIPWAKNSNDRNRNINRHIEQHVINLIDFQEENNFGSLESLSRNFIDHYEASAEEFPEYDIPWAKNSNDRNRNINRHIEQHVINLIDFQEENNFGSLESLSRNFIDHYEASAEEFPEYDIPWEASVTGRILTDSPELVSMEFRLAIFTGGAHGFTSTSYLNFDPETGETYETGDLFTSEFRDYAEQLFRKKNEIPKDQPINSTGYFFEGDSFSLPQNIGFYKNRIILRYNAYEVASYAEGGIQLEILKEDAEEYLKIF